MKSISLKKSAAASPESRLFSRSHWIWPINQHWDIANSYALFRRTFDLGKIPPKALLFITADQSYRLFVNGRFVGRGPARGFQSHWPYDEIDLQPFLQKGRNVLAIRAHHPGRSTFQYLTQGFAGLLVALRLGKMEIVSDMSWKSIRQTNACRDTIPASLQLFNQEHIDLQNTVGDWTAVDFDDADWSAPARSPWNAAPWFSLEPRGIPNLWEKEVVPPRLIGVNQGKNAEGYGDCRDVVALRHREDRSHQPAQASGDSITVTASGRGEFRSYLFDFGKTMIGHLALTIDGAAGGEIVDTHFAETIDAATLTPDLVIPWHCRVALGDRLVCRAGRFHHHFYHHYGFRYLTLTVRDATADFKIAPRLQAMGYPLERKGSFASSDEGLNKIWETCAWTQQVCSLDAYVDTPWREQAQWWGDARVQCCNTFHLSGDARLMRRGIAQIAAQTTPDGVTYGHSPTMAHECVLPDFTLIWFLTLWDHYWQTGSTEALTTHHDTVQKALAYFRQWTNPRTGLLTYDERFWLFLDWTDLEKKGSSSVYNLWLLIALEKLAPLYRQAKQPGEAAKLATWAGHLRRALARLVNPQGLMQDGIDERGKILRETGIHAQTLALIAGLKGVDETAILKKILRPYLAGKSQPKARPSAYWITYLFTVLAERNLGAEVVAYIKKEWAPMAEHGTTWEKFNPVRGEDSFSHAWSAHPIYHLMQIIGGIVQTAPAWKEIRYRPDFIGEHQETVVPSPNGPIVSRWRKNKSEIHVQLKLPPGVHARVELPGLAARRISGQGDWRIPLAAATSSK
jgi:hypothetical protein